MTTVALVYCHTGPGHRAAALALQEVFAQQRLAWQVQLVDLLELPGVQRWFRWLGGIAPGEGHRQHLAQGSASSETGELALPQGLARLCHAPMQWRLRAHWRSTTPDLVASLAPTFSRALHASVVGALPGVPVVTLLTDMLDHPPNFRIEPGPCQHLICGTLQAAAQARAAGYADRQISITSGMILRPSLDRPSIADRACARRALGLDPDRPTGIVMFGGQGSGQMVDIAARLRDRQLILHCGQQQALAERLRAMPSAARHLVVGDTPDLAQCMPLGDFFIGQPEPAGLSEAVQKGLPVITFESAGTLPQQRYSTRWVREQGIGLVLGSLSELRPGVDELLARLPALRRNVQRIDNRAVFELPQILAELLPDAPSTPPPSGARAKPVPAFA